MTLQFTGFFDKKIQNSNALQFAGIFDEKKNHGTFIFFHPKLVGSSGT